MRSFTIVGLPDEAVKEAARRVSLALSNSGFISPDRLNKKVTINLAPADSKKQGAYFDLAIAIGFLISSGQLAPLKERAIFLGELSLEGGIRPLRGLLALLDTARKKGFSHAYVPLRSANEVALLKDINMYAGQSLHDIVDTIRNSEAAQPLKHSYDYVGREEEADSYDFKEIRGQALAKRALEVAAAGRHHVLLVGPPGAGKSILAKAFPTILPGLEREQLLEVGKVLSVAGILDPEEPRITRQFRSPHHSASTSAILGGGNPLRPGEITLAHKGVLFLDEFPEFRRDVLEALRQPLEGRTVQVARSAGTFLFPADFQLIAAANPCPCGFKDDESVACTCTPGQIGRYERKFSGPLLDRIDIIVYTPRLKKEELLDKNETGEPSSQVRKRVEQAHKKQRQRFKEPLYNSAMRPKEIKEHCAITKDSEILLGRAIEKLSLSPRSYHKILKVARTIADLEQKEHIESGHIAEALQYRMQ